MNVARIKAFVQRYLDPLFFLGGFIFDTFAIVRIDCRWDLTIQTLYLFLVTLFIVLQMRVENGQWTPRGGMAKAWHYETEALHFCYGGLLSAYVILYFKSTSSLRSVIFLSFLVLLMFANEMPQVRRAGKLLRVGLHAFCVVSFLNYLFPIFIGRMGWGVFLLAWFTSVALESGLVWFLAEHTDRPARTRWRLGWPPAVVLSAILTLYAFKWIPPVPLSVQHMGIYHSLERDGEDFRLGYQKPPWYHFWAKGERTFVSRAGEPVICFVRVFAPTGFEHRVYFSWKRWDPIRRTWVLRDRIPNFIRGGRAEGFRGTSTKSNYDAGRWRVDVETEDGRVLSTTTFDLRMNPSEPAGPQAHLTM